MYRRVIPVIFMLMSLLILSNCAKEKTEAKNMEQIYAEEGVPVKIREIKPQKFTRSLYFNAPLRGYRESSAFASIGDRVEKILVKVGDYVRKDQVLLTFPTDNPAARYYQAKVAYENAERLYKRMDNLFKTGGISQQDLDNAKTQYEVAKANWDAVRQAVKVKAPISGYVTKIDVRETDNVDSKAELFTIAQTQRMRAEIWVSEKEIEEVKEGLPAVARWNGVEIKGRVVQVNMAMDVIHKAFKAILEFDNPDNRFKCGVTAEIEIESYQNPEAVVIEATDVIKEGDAYFVFVNLDGLAKKRPVELGKQNGMKIEVLKGLKPGDQLIVEGQMLLKEGSKVKITG
ncbi:MAG: efflux RND transporter periplasmic adaptor subunit [Calditrichaeota bacterium]|nr:efflux RND transporter periplasmic adaptor subunit [Calditrichota bacterium]